MSGWSQYFGVFYLSYKIHNTSDYKLYTATPRTTKENFDSSRIKTTDTCVFKKLIQQQNMIIKERQSHTTSGGKKSFSFQFLLSQFCTHAYQPQAMYKQEKGITEFS